jgi:PhoH-like ATPase
MKMRQDNIYVVDTSVLIDDPDIFYKLGNNQIVVPIAVLKELDGIKRNLDPHKRESKSARKVSRTLDQLGSRQDIVKGATTVTGAIVRIYSGHILIDDLASIADNRIVGAALKLTDEGNANVTVLSADANMRNVTRAYGIRAEGYPLRRNK